jgi:hypothetical protein
MMTLGNAPVVTGILFGMGPWGLARVVGEEAPPMTVNVVREETEQAAKLQAACAEIESPPSRVLTRRKVTITHGGASAELVLVEGPGVRRFETLGGQPVQFEMDGQPMRQVDSIDYGKST